MLVNTTCPNCGAQLSVDDTREVLFCSFCGTKIVNFAQKIEVNQTINQNVVHSGQVEYRIDRSSDPTLLIHYSSINPNVKMVVRIVETNQKSVFLSGQNMTFHLLPGKHDLVLKIGKINYNRTIYVPDDYSPVNIYASFDGRARITIDQPNYTVPQCQPQNQYVNNMNPAGSVNYVQNNVSKPKPSWMSVVGFIMSLTVFLSPIALGLCIYDLIKNKGERPKGLTIAGIIISSFIMLAFIARLYNGNSISVS